VTDFKVYFVKVGDQWVSLSNLLTSDSWRSKPYTLKDQSGLLELSGEVKEWTP
jgi:hypothetical protein